MKFKIISIIISLCIILGALSSCSSNSDFHKPSQDNAAKNETETIPNDNVESFSPSFSSNEHSKEYPHASEYDMVVLECDEYYVVKKEEETYNSYTVKYGVIDKTGTWVCPLSDSNGFAQNAKNIMSDPYTSSYGTLSISYLNQNMFLVSSYTIVVENGSIPSGYGATYAAHHAGVIVDSVGKSVCDVDFMVTKFYEGYCFTANKFGRVRRIDLEGNSVDFAVLGSSNQFGMDELDYPSCGLIYCDRAFYDIISCEKIIDLSDYNIAAGYGNHRFSKDGTFTFAFRNSNGTLYEATIDTSGNLISEPQKK